MPSRMHVGVNHCGLEAAMPLQELGLYPEITGALHAPE